MYTIIQHEVRKKFDLSLNEYAVCDSIHNLSRGRLCTQGKEIIADVLGLTKQTVHTILNTLEEYDLIERSKKGVRTTAKWDDAILANKMGVEPESKETVRTESRNFTPTVKKLDSEGKETLHNINKIKINKDINNTPAAESEPTIVSQPKLHPYLIELCDEINHIPRETQKFKREMKAAKYIISCTQDILFHYGGQDIYAALRWIVKIAQDMKKDGHWYMKARPVLPSTIEYCYDEIIQRIRYEKKRREDAEAYSAEYEQLKRPSQ